MLQRMRDQTQSFAFKVLVGLIVFVLAVFGFGAFNLFVTGDPEVASVNGEGITQNELATATDAETEQSLIRELSWVYNQHLPRLPLMNGVRRVFLNRDGWAFPERDSKYMMQNPTTELWSHGQIRAEE